MARWLTFTAPLPGSGGININLSKKLSYTLWNIQYLCFERNKTHFLWNQQTYRYRASSFRLLSLTLRQNWKNAEISKDCNVLQTMYIISIIHDLDGSFSWYSKFLQLCHSYCESHYKGQVPTWRSLLPTYQYIKNACERKSQILEKILGQWWFMEFKLSNGFMKKLSLITANAIFPIAIVSWQ